MKNAWKLALTKPFAQTEQDSESGMTIIEILIVIALIGTIMTIVMSNIMSSAENAKKDLARVAMVKLSDDIRLYKLNNSKVPSSEEGLNALLEKPASAKSWRGPYTESDRLNDPWGQVFTYEAIDGTRFKLVSAGPDTEVGTDDDIEYPDANKTKDEAPVSTELKVPVSQEPNAQ